MNGDFGTAPLKKGEMAWPAYSHCPGWQTESSAIHLRMGAAALQSAPHGRAQGERCDVSNGATSQAYLNKVARQLNERPRETLQFETPAERFNACVASTLRAAFETHLRHEPEKTSRSRIKRLRGVRRPQYIAPSHRSPN